jgi:hypothetical protein
MQPEDLAEYMIAQLKLHPRIFVFLLNRQVFGLPIGFIVTRVTQSFVD